MAPLQNPLAKTNTYIWILHDLATVKHVALFIYKTSQKADMLHSWKIYVNIHINILHIVLQSDLKGSQVEVTKNLSRVFGSPKRSLVIC